jgi:hypothetical protein
MVRRCFAFILVPLVFAAAGTVTLDAAIAPGPSTPKVRPEHCTQSPPIPGAEITAAEEPVGIEMFGESGRLYVCSVLVAGAA